MSSQLSSPGTSSRLLVGVSYGSRDDPVLLSDGSEDEKSSNAEHKYDITDDYPNQLGYTTAASRATGSRDPYKNKKFRWWFFTWNNPTDPRDRESLLHGNFRWIKFQYERGANGTPHYQGIIYIESPSTCTNLMRKFGWSYLAPVRNIKRASDYCGKEDTRLAGPWENGEFPNQGKRSDLLKTKEIIDNGGSMKDVFEQCYGSAVRYHTGISKYKALTAKPRTWQTVCYVYYGDAGMGKTEAAKEEARVWGGGTFWLSLEGGTNKVWWDGYDGEENVVIDEFNCQIPFTDFKRLIDSTPLTVPAKGCMLPFVAKRIWILSNRDVNTFYHKSFSTDHLRNSFMRRIHYKEGFFEKFLGQPDYDSFIFSRSQFVLAQQAGEFVINTNKD